ncbi:MAG TPA: ribonucleoside-diphosphate reductase subunit alpha [Thermodesulfobacteriota bacterium]|nr:ribonucleoside-diphosphate reductase subunit alpha [Thermodesulfobacteriota bacterium]
MVNINLIKKRDGRIVEFDRVRIEAAISKAFAATLGKPDEKLIRNITDDVLEEIEKQFGERVPGVENIQDLVERNIVGHGYLRVATAYILYREDHKKKRLDKKRELIDKVNKGLIGVRKRSGAVKPFDAHEIERFIRSCCSGAEEPAMVDEIIDEAKSLMYDGITTRDINQAVVMVCRSRIETDLTYSYLAARVLLNDLYKDVIGRYEYEDGFEAAYRETFRKSVAAGVAQGRYSEGLAGYDLDAMSRALDPSRDGLLKYLGLQTLYDRYLMKDYDQNILEVPQYFWMRVAMGLALNEEDKEGKAIEFYDTISAMRYVPSTPTLFHSGTVNPQMSSCYLLTCADELDNIFKTMGDVARLAKWSGGIGIDWTAIRGTGAMIRSTNVNSQGVIPFLKILDSTTSAINRSGKRRGATCAYLEVWHYDFEDFLELRKNTGDERRRTHDLNIAAWVPDLFIKRVIDKGDWTFFSPDETPDLHGLYGKAFERRYEEYERAADRGGIRLSKRVPAQKLWRKIITMLYETGHPWLTFKDPCNIRSPQDHQGVVNSSNLCTEITLNTSCDEFAVCNLGSVNLSLHIKDGALDEAALSGTIRTAVRMLDNSIDLNFYPTGETRRSNLAHRPIGLGVMGFQDALYQAGLDFASDGAVKFSDLVMETVSWHAISASSDLAAERGKYSSYKGSKWDRGLFPLDTMKMLEEERGVPTSIGMGSRLDWAGLKSKVRCQGMRNSNCIAIAPTATIANIAGCYPSIEPIYKNLYVKSNLSGEFTMVNQFLIDDLREIGLWDRSMLEKLKQTDGSIVGIKELPGELRDKYRGAFEIDPSWVILHAAYRSKWIDQSQSVNIFVDTVSGERISETYLSAWKSGLKTTYYLRSLGASGVEKSTIEAGGHISAGAAREAEETLNACNLEEGCESCQ